MIYESVAADSEAIVKGDSNLMTGSTFARVSKQTRSESQVTLAANASRIVAQVKDYDFSRMVKFLEMLLEQGLKTRPGMAGTKPQREFAVVFWAPLPCTSYLHKLLPWFDRSVDPSTRGASLEVTYTAKAHQEKWYHGKYDAQRLNNARIRFEILRRVMVRNGDPKPRGSNQIVPAVTEMVRGLVRFKDDFV